jgi:DNA-binding transcriptional ArsR family regulator
MRIYGFMKIQTDRMLTAADEATTLLKALANRRRLVIVCQLLEKERSVGELAKLLKARDSTVSQHLALLRKDGLVAARRDAQTIWYSIASEAAREVVAALYRAYCAPACTPKRTKKPARRRILEPNQ